VVASKSVTLRIKCGAATGKVCTGTLVMRAPVSGKTRVLGRKTFRISGGKNARVKVSLSSTARTALKAGKRLSVTARTENAKVGGTAVSARVTAVSFFAASHA
jgi:hypothetical protein